MKKRTKSETSESAESKGKQEGTPIKYASKTRFSCEQLLCIAELLKDHVHDPLLSQEAFNKYRENKKYPRVFPTTKGDHFKTALRLLYHNNPDIMLRESSTVSNTFVYALKSDSKYYEIVKRIKKLFAPPEQPPQETATAGSSSSHSSPKKAPTVTPTPAPVANNKNEKDKVPANQQDTTTRTTSEASSSGSSSESEHQPARPKKLSKKSIKSPKSSKGVRFSDSFLEVTTPRLSYSSDVAESDSQPLHSTTTRTSVTTSPLPTTKNQQSPPRAVGNVEPAVASDSDSNSDSSSGEEDTSTCSSSEEDEDILGLTVDMEIVPSKDESDEVAEGGEMPESENPSDQIQIDSASAPQKSSRTSNIDKNSAKYEVYRLLAHLLKLRIGEPVLSSVLWDDFNSDPSLPNACPSKTEFQRHVSGLARQFPHLIAATPSDKKGMFLWSLQNGMESYNQLIAQIGEIDFGSNRKTLAVKTSGGGVREVQMKDGGSDTDDLKTGALILSGLPVFNDDSTQEDSTGDQSVADGESSSGVEVRKNRPLVARSGSGGSKAPKKKAKSNVDPFANAQVRERALCVVRILNDSLGVSVPFYQIWSKYCDTEIEESRVSNTALRHTLDRLCSVFPRFVIRTKTPDNYISYCLRSEQGRNEITSYLNSPVGSTSPAVPSSLSPTPRSTTTSTTTRKEKSSRKKRSPPSLNNSDEARNQSTSSPIPLAPPPPTTTTMESVMNFGGEKVANEAFFSMPFALPLPTSQPSLKFNYQVNAPKALTMMDILNQKSGVPLTPNDIIDLSEPATQKLGTENEVYLILCALVKSFPGRVRKTPVFQDLYAFSLAPGAYDFVRDKLVLIGTGRSQQSAPKAVSTTDRAERGTRAASGSPSPPEGGRRVRMWFEYMGPPPDLRRRSRSTGSSDSEPPKPKRRKTPQDGSAKPQQSPQPQDKAPLQQIHQISAPSITPEQSTPAPSLILHPPTVSALNIQPPSAVEGEQPTMVTENGQNAPPDLNWDLPPNA